MSENIRIRTTPGGTDKYLNVKLEQDFDFIEILSLKISQDKVYQNFCSDYGVIVGRVSINNGFGIPNAKVSVFIPIDDADKQDPHISGLYPYETVNDKNSDGIRYNLLPKESDSQDDCYTVVGTFPAKREVLDNDDMLYVYCKYYKFNAVTNHAGDFMIFGVPLGAHTIHVDADISNIGIASQRPYDLIDQGTPSKMFYSPTKFKDSKNLNSLIQIKSANVGVNVHPFWGDTDNCQIGINRADIDLNFSIRPAAIFMGSVFGDSERNSFNKRCRPRKKMGQMCEQIAKEGTIEMIRKDKDDQIEKFDIEGGRLIDSNGAWAYQIPCNLDYVITDEFGILVPSEDDTKGVPTRTRVRFRISMDDGSIADGGLESDDLFGSGGGRIRGKYLVPHNPTSSAASDYTFDKRTNDAHFVNLYWNKIYTVKNFIARTQKADTWFDVVTGLERVINYSGIKHVDACVGDKNPFPFNRTYTRNSVLFTIICFIVTLIAFIVSILNAFLCWLRDLGFSTWVLSWHPFRGINPISMKCVVDDNEYYFNPGCGDSVESYTDCVSIGLALGLDMFEMHFFNDWVNGTLYYPLVKVKARRRGRKKFCEYQCDDFGGVGDNNCRLMDICDSTIGDVSDAPKIGFRNGVLTRFENKLYYPPIVWDGQGSSPLKLFAADIVNLGAVMDCDWQGFPKIIQYLTDTSYKAPPLVEEHDPESNTYITGQIECGGKWAGLFFSINCIGLHIDSNRATNIRRQCELQVDLAESHTPGSKTTSISAQEIYDIQSINLPLVTELSTNLNKYVRDSFTLLNIGGAGIASYPPAQDNMQLGWTYASVNLDTGAGGTSFAIGGNCCNQDHNCGTTYLKFRNNPWGQNGADIGFQALGNSYYFYFGAEPNGTAINKLNAKYFTPCIKVNPDDFIISSTVTNTSLNGLSDGSISFTILGGTGPFTYTVTNNATTVIGPLQTSTFPIVLNNLPAGVYTITVVDSLQTSQIKDVEVTGPPKLVLSVSAKHNACKPTGTDGIASVTIANGIAPYQASYLNQTTGANVTIPNPAAGTQDITGLGVGTYIFSVTDSVGTTETATISIQSPPPLLLNIPAQNVGYRYVSCSESNDGYIKPKVTGGTAPYMVTVTSSNATNGAYSSGPINYQQINFSNLYPGDYTITVTDAAGGTCQQTATTTVRIYKYIPPTITALPNTKQCDPAKYTINFIANHGIPQSQFEIYTPAPYQIFISIDGGGDQSFGQANDGVNTIYITPAIAAILRITIKDSNGCYANLQLAEATFHRPLFKLFMDPSSYREATPLPGYAVGTGVIHWTPVADISWPAFLPVQVFPRDNINQLGAATYSARTTSLVPGYVTNGVGCSSQPPDGTGYLNR